jgi:AdoMet-dependent heme synthase
MQPYTRSDFDHSPMLVFYEMTRACDLACVHCRADAQRGCDPDELSADDALRLVDQLGQFPRTPLLVLTGGDPLKRADVFDVVEYCRDGRVPVAMTPSATPLVTYDALQCLKQAGLHRLAISLDGADAQTHDAFRGVGGSYARTLQIMAEAHLVGLPLQINITIARHNVHQLDHLLELAAKVGACLASVFFLVPTGRATAESRLSAEECEQVFQTLWRWQKSGRVPIKTTEAPHYRRFILQQQKAQRSGEGERPAGIPLGQIGTNDGKGILFVSHTGEIYPSGFLPIACGRVPFESLVKVYQESMLFRTLRDADQLKGKCHACEFREICGGSRARSFGLTGDPLAEEPDCTYVPPRYRTASTPC